MKVVIVLCVKEFRDDLNEILRDLDVQAYSETDVRGVKHEHQVGMQVENWFGSEENPYNSVANFTFVSDDKAELILERISQFNDNLECCSPMHAFMLNVEKKV